LADTFREEQTVGSREERPEDYSDSNCCPVDDAVVRTRFLEWLILVTRVNAKPQEQGNGQVSEKPKRIPIRSTRDGSGEYLQENRRDGGWGPGSDQQTKSENPSQSNGELFASRPKREGYQEKREHSVISVSLGDVTAAPIRFDRGRIEKARKNG
jgi:hypothetical protein